MSAMLDALDAELSEVPDFALDFATLLQAAQAYEQEMAPEFLALCQREPQAWQALSDHLRAGETQNALTALLADQPDATALSQALLATALDQLAHCVEALKALRLAADDEEQNSPGYALTTALLNLLEAHCFGSAPARAPAMLQAALQALQSQSLAPLQALAPDLPPAPELASWLGQQAPERLSELRDACHARLRTATGTEAGLLGDWLVALNSSLMIQI